MQPAGKQDVPKCELSGRHTSGDSDEEDPPRIQILDHVTGGRLGRLRPLLQGADDADRRPAVIVGLKFIVLIDAFGAVDRTPRRQPLKDGLILVDSGGDDREVDLAFDIGDGERTALCFLSAQFNTAPMLFAVSLPSPSAAFFASYNRPCHIQMTQGFPQYRG